jgi:hypothetical protein
MCFKSCTLAPGEKVCIAVDLAAQRALLDLWGVSNHKLAFPFKNISVFSDAFKQHAVDQNHSIGDVCGERFVCYCYAVVNSSHYRYQLSAPI